MGEQHEVLAIVGSRRNANGEVEYRIRWKGFSQDGDTWQTRQTVEHTAVFMDYIASKEGNKENIPEIICDDETISDIEETEDVSQSTTPLGNTECHVSPMEISYPVRPEGKEESLWAKEQEPASSGLVKNHTLPPRVRRAPISRKRAEPSISRFHSPPSWNEDLLSMRDRKKKRTWSTDNRENWCDPIIFYWRETNRTRSVKLFDCVGKHFDTNYTPRMLVGRPSHGDVYQKQRSRLIKPNVKLKIRVSKKKEQEAVKFFRYLRGHPRLGLFMHDFRDQRLLLYVHSPSRKLPTELYATKLMVPQRHELNFMLGRFKHDPSIGTLSRKLTRLLQVLPRPAKAEVFFSRAPEQRIELTFGRETKEFTRDHVANFVKRNGKVLLTIAGEILVLTKGSECSISCISTRRYEQKTYHNTLSASFQGTLKNPAGNTKKIKSVLNDIREYCHFTEEEIFRLFKEMSNRQCRIVFTSLRVCDLLINSIFNEMEENLSRKSNAAVKVSDSVSSEKGATILYQIY